MDRLYEARKEYGSTLGTLFPNGLFVPWKPLSLKKYIQYHQDNNRNLISAAQLEDEIFKQCVTDDAVVRQMPFFKAGIITTVVQNIWEYSGPQDVERFNRDLQLAREVLTANGVRGLHELVKVITMAFPYKPEEIYEMEYETVLIRAAQAEDKLLQLGALKEPLSFLDETEQQQPQQPPPERPLQNVDPRELWEQQRKAKTTKPPPQPAPASAPKTPSGKKKWWDKSPVLEGPGTHKIDFEQERAEHDVFGVSSHEATDLHINRAKMVEDAQVIYADLLEELKKKHDKPK